ncbi:MAG TPA: Lrp/AsnC family transcriptional regulator [Casimicrobiaceae bacterium]
MVASMWESRLVGAFQRDFPLEPAPYAVIGGALGVSESSVLDSLARLVGEGVVSRVGGVFRAGSLGASTLVAIAVPPASLAAVAGRVSGWPGVNHSYEREHRFNLWLVVHAPDREVLAGLVARLGQETDCETLALPLEREFHIDLGFDLDVDRRADAGECTRPLRAPVPSRPPTPAALDVRGQAIAAVLQPGLQLVPRPYASLARRAGLPAAGGEDDVLAQLSRWLDDGTLRRLGVIVRHRPLGYQANAMAVWDVPDDELEGAGSRLASEAAVNLAYARTRARPAWPYNLYCVVHGRIRAEVDAELDAIGARWRLDRHPHLRLFSRTAFKQCGARTFEAATDG